MSANATIPQSRAPDDDPGLGLAIEFGLLHSIALILYSLRMYSRIRPKMLLWWDDLFLTLAVVSSLQQSRAACGDDLLKDDPSLFQCFSLVSLSFACASLKWGLGRHNYYLDPESTMYATKYLWLSEWPYAWGLVFGKIAITVTLLRILHQSIWWRWVLCSMCVLQVLIAVCMNAFFFSQCTPLAMNWDPSATGTCKPLYVAQIRQVFLFWGENHGPPANMSICSIYVNAALTITTDFILSLIPITFLRKLQRPLRERIAIGCLMGLGLIASCASIYKTTLATSYGNTGDALRDSVGLTVWSILEMELG